MTKHKLEDAPSEKPPFLNARRFSILLWISIVLLVALAVGIFVFGYQELGKYATDISKKKADAVASQNSLANLQILEKRLEQLDGLKENLSSITAPSDLPQFQAEASLRAIAGFTGITIKQVTFINDAPSTAAGSKAAKSTVTPTATATPGSGSSTKTTKISFELAQPISYAQLITFLNAVETSAPKLQIVSVSLPGDASKSRIELGQLTLEMAIK